MSGLKKAGYSNLVGCRGGGCAVCKAELLGGEVSYDDPVADSVLTADERAGGTCLTCRAVPESDVTIEMRNELRLISPLLRQLNEKARVKAKSVISGTESKE